MAGWAPTHKKGEMMLLNLATIVRKVIYRLEEFYREE